MTSEEPSCLHAGSESTLVCLESGKTSQRKWCLSPDLSKKVPSFTSPVQGWHGAQWHPSKNILVSWAAGAEFCTEHQQEAWRASGELESVQYLLGGGGTLSWGDPQILSKNWLLPMGSWRKSSLPPVTCFLDKARSGLSRLVLGSGPIVCRVPGTPWILIASIQSD